MGILDIQTFNLVSWWQPPVQAKPTVPSAPRRSRPVRSETSTQAMLISAQAKRDRRQDRLRSLTAPTQPRPVPEWSSPELEARIAREVQQARFQRATVLRAVRGLVRRHVYRDILAYIKDCDYTSMFSIERQPCPASQLQDQVEYAFKRAFINQYRNGGYSGDDFGGWISIPLNAGRYLQFHYSA